MMSEFPSPLRLAVGSHKAGSGKGCAMNVISWENGDIKITDMPPCADPMLTKVVQRVNDTICTHRGRSDLLCVDCSQKVLKLAHRTMGTALTHMSQELACRVYVRLALDEAESVARTDEHVTVTDLRRVIGGWLLGKNDAGDVRRAAAGAEAYYSVPGFMLDGARGTARRAAQAVSCAALYDDLLAANAAAAATLAATADADALSRAHALIDRFEALTGIVGNQPETADVMAAYEKMTRVGVS